MQKRSFLLVFFLVAIHVSRAQEQLKITALNRVTINRSDTVYQFFVKKAPAKFKTQQDMVYHWFVPDTILTTQGSFGDKLLDGSFKIYYPNKNLKEEGSFVYGTKSGLWKSWSLEGRLLSVTNWQRGIKNGFFAEYGADGRVVNSGTFKNGKLVPPNEGNQ